MGLVLVDQDATIADFERALLDAFRARHPGAPFIGIADRSEVSARKQYGPLWGPAVDAIMKTEGFYLPARDPRRGPGPGRDARGRA